ncbi:multicopper oxidase domain-containing protein [Nitrosococcus watsonii]|uniref:Multicopper oxidase type 3 n=1 Tax=Nitrosococcus watsoni (strain C-113) TaxID=105559 RepID=D8KBU8_NITWC|nr:multicopper oxidase domain-containing protein [Nitrosococcus watsonii]ADJ27709.1 multicopper oxidase type 3 [Nitrosococcus watsonii C-113]
MKLLNTIWNNVRQPGGQFLSGSILILLGMFLSTQQTWAKEWVFTVPIGEISVLSSGKQSESAVVHVNKGDNVVIHVKNNTPVDHTVRWHGVHEMNHEHKDGALEKSKRFLSIQEAVEAGGNFTYRWKAEKTGAFWYHCHINANEQVARIDM